MPQAQTTSQGCSLLPGLAVTAGRQAGLGTLATTGHGRQAKLGSPGTAQTRAGPEASLCLTEAAQSVKQENSFTALKGYNQEFYESNNYLLIIKSKLNAKRCTFLIKSD